MFQSLFHAGIFFENSIAGIAIIAIIPLSIKLIKGLKEENSNRRNNLINIGLIIACLFIINQVNIFHSTVTIMPYDGTHMIYKERYFFIFHRNTNLYLRYDPEIDSKIWMARKDGEYYPFFVEDIGY